MFFYPFSDTFYPPVTQDLTFTKVIQIGKYKYRIVYIDENDSKTAVRLERKRATIFGQWKELFIDTYDACIESLRYRVKDYREKEKKIAKPRLALIRPKDLE